MTTWVKVDLDGLSTNEFTVTVALVHGEADQVVSSYDLTGTEVLAGDGVLPNMIRVDMPAVTSVGTYDCKQCDDPSGPCYYYATCDGTEGRRNGHRAFQFFSISFHAFGPAA